jgi:hypothetical protein
LRWAGVHQIASWRPLHAELVQPTQFPDGLLEAKLADETKPTLFALELATYPDRRVATQAARDATLAWLDRACKHESHSCRVE